MYMIVYIQDESVGEENRIALDDEEEGGTNCAWKIY